MTEIRNKTQQKKFWLFGHWVIGIFLGFGIWLLGFNRLHYD
jgi:hypothetical protein